MTVTNNTAESLDVFVQYQESGKSKSDEWVKWTISAGSNVRLVVNDKPIEATRLRIWAVGAKTGKKFDLLKNRDIVLVEGNYRGLKMDTHVHRFGD